MEAKTIVCTAVLPNGQTCGETALVHGVRYYYDRLSWPEPDRYILRATAYQIACPRCGDREQVEPA